MRLPGTTYCATSESTMTKSSINAPISTGAGVTDRATDCGRTGRKRANKKRCATDDTKYKSIEQEEIDTTSWLHLD